MQDDSQNNLTSFFQVGGIHGLPYIPWDGSGNQSQSNQSHWEGYCLHGSVLFPTWHRPYVTLIEQILSGYAQQIANRYIVHQASWRSAARLLRFPYWDWAQNAVPPPEVISLDQVNISAPNGSRILVSNPLRRYKFHPIDPSFYTPYSQWPTTLRRPNSTNPNATDDINALQSMLQAAQNSTTINTFNTLTRITMWRNFSTYNLNPFTHSGISGYDGSLESIHDSIHVIVGGLGHMANQDVAGFDPIFFLHHCNVDRMVALWSAINLGQWVTPGDSAMGTFTLPPDFPVDTNTPLTPFWFNQTSFWPSSAISNTSSLGYTYPEFLGLETSNSTTLRDAILNQVNQLYGDTSRHALTALGNETTGQFQEWNAHVVFNDQEAGSSFSILFFLGDVPEDPSQWSLSSNHVGSAHAFVAPSVGAPQNDSFHRGLVPLNEGIAQHSGLSSFDSSEVEPYLTENLHWRVLKVDGSPVELESLVVTVLEIPVSLAEEGDIPIAGEPIEHGGITEGRSE